MRALEQLREIASSQKTVSTSRLIELLDGAERERIQQANKIKRQTTTLNRLNKEVQQLRAKVKDFDTIRVKHSRLKTEYALLLEKTKRRGETVG